MVRARSELYMHSNPPRDAQSMKEPIERFLKQALFVIAILAVRIIHALVFWGLVMALLS